MLQWALPPQWTFLSAQIWNSKNVNNPFYPWFVFFQLQAICNIIWLPLPFFYCQLSDKSQPPGCVFSSQPVKLHQTLWLVEAKLGCGKILQFNKIIIKPSFLNIGKKMTGLPVGGSITQQTRLVKLVISVLSVILSASPEMKNVCSLYWFPH